MVRTKQQFPETVQLVLSGPKSILKETMVVDARLDQSWYEVLNGEPDLQVAPQSGIFVCSSNYTPTAPKSGQGWRCELDEEIRNFVSQFERKKRQYYVRLCHPDILLRRSSSLNRSPPPERSGSPQRTPNIVIPTRGQLPVVPVAPTPTPRSSQRQKRQHQQTLEETSLGTSGQAKLIKLQNPDGSSSEQGQQRGTGRRGNAEEEGGEGSILRIDHIASIAAVKLELDLEEPEVEEEEHEETDEGNETWDQEDWNSTEPEVNGNAISNNFNEDDDLDDNFSLCTAAEEIDLRREGIKVEELKPLAEARMTRFSNGFMCQVRNEIQKLRGNNHWDRNVKRAPLACYLLQEMFKQLE